MLLGALLELVNSSRSCCKGSLEIRAFERAGNLSLTGSKAGWQLKGAILHPSLFRKRHHCVLTVSVACLSNCRCHS